MIIEVFIKSSLKFIKICLWEASHNVCYDIQSECNFVKEREKCEQRRGCILQGDKNICGYLCMISLWMTLLYLFLFLINILQWVFFKWGGKKPLKDTENKVLELLSQFIHSIKK